MWILPIIEVQSFLVEDPALGVFDYFLNGFWEPRGLRGAG
ncbi:hypothetical protein ALQ34_200091 [Pseudomonas syringae pv. maculicola]|nr:hypothetical protein ALQ34_200091 [Pseudomonas syringae pv. maculicola]